MHVGESMEVGQNCQCRPAGIAANSASGRISELSGSGGGAEPARFEARYLLYSQTRHGAAKDPVHCDSWCLSSAVQLSVWKTRKSQRAHCAEHLGSWFRRRAGQWHIAAHPISRCVWARPDG